MYEFEILVLETGERDIIQGYNFVDACARFGLDPSEVEVLFQEYVD